MTKARLTTWIDWDPDKTGIGADLPGPNAVQMDVTVNDGDDPITVVVTSDGVSTSVRTEPTFVTVPAFEDEQLIVNLSHIDNALRNGSNMTKANRAFDSLCYSLGVDPQRFIEEPPPVNPKFWQCEELGYHQSATTRHTFEECQAKTGLEVQR